MKNKKKIIFICFGNICRSPMAEFIFKSIMKDNEFYVCSGAVSNEECGNDIYPYTKDVLDKHNIKYSRHYAHKITMDEYNSYDYIICMEKRHVEILKSMYGKNDKVKTLINSDIEDPWYTGNFEKVYNQIYNGSLELYKSISKN